MRASPRTSEVILCSLTVASRRLLPDYSRLPRAVEGYEGVWLDQYKERWSLFKGDSESVALHVSLLGVYDGRLRLGLLGWLGNWLPLVRPWILAPFDRARSTIGAAEKIHPHSAVDVLSYRAEALAHLNRCADAQEDFDRIERLVGMLTDQARTQYWREQRERLERRWA